MFMIVLLLNLQCNDFSLNGFEGEIMLATGIHMRQVECMEVLNIVQSTINGAHLVDHRINHVDNEDLRVGGMKWFNVNFIVSWCWVMRYFVHSR